MVGALLFFVVLSDGCLEFQDTVMAPVVITICFRELLHDVCRRYSLPAPMYDVPLEDEEGMISVYAEIDLLRGDSGPEPLRTWSIPCCNIDQAEEDAARRCVGKLRDELSFEVDDFNFEDKIFFEHLCYNDLLAEKARYVTERARLKKLTAEFHEVLDRPHAVAVAENSAAGNSGVAPAVPPGYEP